MNARPSPTAVTIPLSSTVATFGFDEANVLLAVRLPT
jgi:hypothetical protein